MDLFRNILLKVKKPNDLKKYALDKKISAGEKFYELSGLSLTVFEATLRTFEKINDFNSNEAKSVYINVQTQYESIAKAITNTTNTITAADIYYAISGVNDVNKWLAEYQQKIAELNEAVASGKLANAPEMGKDLIALLKNLITTLKGDRATIANEINRLLP